MFLMWPRGARGRNDAVTLMLNDPTGKLSLSKNRTWSTLDHAKLVFTISRPGFWCCVPDGVVSVFEADPFSFACV